MRTVVALCRELIADRRSDGELLTAFIANTSEDSFVELIRRHGPLVWGACCRLLPNPADAEDAFQAAFLVLVRRAHRLKDAAAIGPWLHRVTVWTARNVRRKNARRFARQTDLPEQLTDPNSPLDSDLKADLDAALAALPSQYRDSIILCHLQGFTRREAAELLGCAEGTLSARLSRGLEKLRKRLRDFDPTKALGVGVAVPTLLAVNTVRAATATTVAAATVAPAVNSLVEGVLHMFWMKKATAATIALFATFALGVGMGVGGRGDYSGATAGEPVVPGKSASAGRDKPAPAAQKKDAAPPQEVAKEIADLEAQIQAMLLICRNNAADYEAIRAKLDFLEKEKNAGNATEDVVSLARRAMSEHTQKVNESKQQLKTLRDRLAALEAEKTKVKEKPVPAPKKKDASPLRDLTKELETVDLEAKIRELELTHRNNLADIEAARARVQFFDKAKSAGNATEDEVNETFRALSIYMRKAEDSARQLNALKEKLAALKAEQTKAQGVKLTRGHLELTISGKAGDYVFELKETDASGKILGIVTVRDISGDAVMLTRLLARTKADPTAPTELRVTAQPQTTLGYGPRAAFKASSAAGYKTVKFTGYVFGGGFAQEIPSDEKGDVLGYKRYDATEKNPSELIKEIEDGLRKW